MTNRQPGTGAPDLPDGWRFKVGIVLFALAIGLMLTPFWILFPLIFHNQPLSTIVSLVFAAVILQKIILLGAIVALGKPGFVYFKSLFFQKLSPPAAVGPLRYKIGLIMFSLPFAQKLLETYASHIVPHLLANRLWVDVLMDLMFLASLFVLGGHFWDKLRSLFFVDARAVFPNENNNS